MPPRQRINKRIILEESLNITVIKGLDGLNARAIAKALSISTQPIFSYFENMADLKSAVVNSVFKLFAQRVNSFNGLLNFEIELIAFSNEYPTYFSILFGESSTLESTKKEIDRNAKDLVSSIAKEFKIPKDKANVIYLNNWIYSFGLASLVAKHIIPYNRSSLEKLLRVNIDSSVATIKKRP